MLAWIRTALALLAAGVALEALGLPVDSGFRLAAAAVFVGLGLLAAVEAWLGWVRTERALRERRVLPGPSVGLALSIGVILGGVLVVLGYLQ